MMMKLLLQSPSDGDDDDVAVIDALVARW